MPTVQADIVIPASPEVVYRAAQDIEGLVDFLPDVEEIHVLSRDGPRVRSAWVGRVPEFHRNIRWTEEDEWVDAERLCRFRALEGDWDRYEGVWTFAGHPNGARVELVIDYEINVPLIGPLIKKLLQKLVQRNAEEMLDALKRRVGAG